MRFFKGVGGSEIAGKRQKTHAPTLRRQRSEVRILLGAPLKSNDFMILEFRQILSSDFVLSSFYKQKLHKKYVQDSSRRLLWIVGQSGGQALSESDTRVDVRGDGRVILYKRDGLKRPKWQARIRVPNSSGYKIITTKTDNLKEAERFALDVYEDLYLHVKAGGSGRNRVGGPR